MPRLTRITLHPVKSLPGVDVDEAALTAQGGLVHDREYALAWRGSEMVSGKRHPRLHALEASLAIAGTTILVTIGSGAAAATYALGDDAPASERAALEACLSERLGEPVHLLRDTAGGYPDDPDNPGPTVAAEASLAEVATWFPALSLDNLRHRLRGNLELGDCPAFWEDHLVGEPGVDIPFRVGAAELLGTNPCKRCVVPTRDPFTGERTEGFMRTFMQRRKDTLPPWAIPARFDTYYRLATNTRVQGDQRGRVIRVGDEVRVA